MVYVESYIVIIYIIISYMNDEISSYFQNAISHLLIFPYVKSENKTRQCFEKFPTKSVNCVLLGTNVGWTASEDNRKAEI